MENINNDVKVYISNTDWHYKIIKYVLGKNNIPKRMLQYSYVLFLCILISPFVWLYKLVY